MTTPQDPQDRQLPGYPGLTPPDGAAPRSAGPAGTRPAEVDLSFKLWVVSLVLGLVGLVYFVIEFDTFSATAVEEVRRQLAAQGSTIDEAQAKSITTAGLIGAVVIGLLASSVQLLIAFFMRKGRNWARITLAVIGGAGVLFGLSSLAAAPGFQLILSLISYIVVIGAVVTMFLPAANPWFRSRPGNAG